MTGTERRIGFLVFPEEQETLRRGLEQAQRSGFQTWVAMETPEATVAENAEGTDLLVTVGGDGTFLYGARLAAPRGIPVLGVNRGRLGFLTDVEVSELGAAIKAFADGLARTQRRTLLHAHVPGAPPEQTPLLDVLALNDVAVKSEGVKVARFHVETDEELFGEFDADGIIVATATGSTAYALSAGGPPIDPRVRALVVVPLAPHAVPTRPVVIPEAVSLAITLRRGRAVVAADGGQDLQLSDGDVLTVRAGPELRVVHFPGSPTFFEQLRVKLRFGVPLKDLDRGGGKPQASAEADALTKEA